MTRYPLIKRFLGAYMHQDWHDDYADEWAAVADFMHDAPDEVAPFQSEIAALLAEHQFEDQVKSVVLDELRSCYMPDVLGWKYRDWLKALSDHAAKTIGHPQAS
jgi:hypothetical protein